MTQLFKCPGCGGPVSPAAQACPRCGQQIAGMAPREQPPAEQTLRSPQGEVGPVVAPTAPMPALNEADVAAAAAAPLPETPAPPEVASAPAPSVDSAAVMAQQPPRKRRRIGLIIGLSVGIPVGVILILVIVGAVVGAMYAADAEEAMYAAAAAEVDALSQAEQQMTVAVDLMMLKASAEAYRIQFPGSCPTPAQMIAAGYLTPETKTADPWGYLYVITCPAGAVDAYSVGPDGLGGTADDIHG